MRSFLGRTMGVLVVGLVMVSFVGLAATETFINKTGHDVYGIRVEFSTRVTIIRHDYVFPDQSPTGRSDAFTFSGGKLHKFQRFTIAWIPGTAEVVNYEWLEEEQTAPPTPQEETPAEEAPQPATPPLPDPNTPPILYGDDYPGPGEPLYQPKPDEQIWLTDLEGHGDIYDNDGIKINYAPGFDKSKISVIRVYRNGVFMRFLPEKFDVLTNAQMKTFDGNSLEHSPASAHTDHAIMGYEYEFDIYTTDHLWILKKTVKSGFRWRPKEIWAQMGTSWHWNRVDRYSLDDIVKFFTYLKQDGFTGVSLGINYYMSTPYDNEVFPVYDPHSDICFGGGITTPTSAELEKMLKAVTEAKLDIHIDGYIYISQEYQNKHGFTWRDMVNPKDPAKFFGSYTDLWLELVPLLNRYHVKLITPFDEMETIEKYYPDFIKETFSAISEVYDGELGIDEATHNMLMGNSPINRTPIHSVSAFESLVRDFTFWDWKDSHGRPIRIEYSCWTVPVETQRDQRVSVMVPNFVKFWNIPVDYYRAKYPDDPQMFGEIGAQNADGQSLGSEYWDIKNKVMDEQERADYILAALKGAKALNVNYVNIWGDFYVGEWASPSVGATRIATGHYNIRPSPIYRVITAIIKPEEVSLISAEATAVDRSTLPN